MLLLLLLLLLLPLLLQGIVVGPALCWMSWMVQQGVLTTTVQWQHWSNSSQVRLGGGVHCSAGSSVTLGVLSAVQQGHSTASTTAQTA
jgi:hypothetical protein